MDSSCDAYLETSPPSSIIGIRSSCAVCKILTIVIAIAVSGSGFSASRCSQGLVFFSLIPVALASFLRAVSQFLVTFCGNL